MDTQFHPGRSLTGAALQIFVRKVGLGVRLVRNPKPDHVRFLWLDCGESRVTQRFWCLSCAFQCGDRLLHKDFTGCGIESIDPDAELLARDFELALLVGEPALGDPGSIMDTDRLHVQSMSWDGAGGVVVLAPTMSCGSDVSMTACSPRSPAATSSIGPRSLDPARCSQP